MSMMGRSASSVRDCPRVRPILSPIWRRCARARPGQATERTRLAARLDNTDGISSSVGCLASAPGSLDATESLVLSLDSESMTTSMTRSLTGLSLVTDVAVDTLSDILSLRFVAFSMSNWGEDIVFNSLTSGFVIVKQRRAAFFITAVTHNPNTRFIYQHRLCCNLLSVCCNISSHTFARC